MAVVILAISIGFPVANFLLNTCRFLKAIELLKECWAIVNNRPAIEEEVFKLSYKMIYWKMFEAYCLTNNYTCAIQYGSTLISLCQKSGERGMESKIISNLAKLYQRQSKYSEAKELFEKALAINVEIGNRKGEASAYGNLGTVFQSVGEYTKAEDYLEKALNIIKVIGDRSQEATCYINLGVLFNVLGEHYKAKDYIEKALLIKKEIGDKTGEASCYGNLGNVFLSLGEYYNSVEYVQKALTKRIEIGDRNGEAADYGRLGNVFRLFGEHVKAKEYIEKALAIRKETGDKKGQAADYGNLGNVFISQSEYARGKYYHEKALVISQEIGDRYGEASSYGTLGAAFVFLGEYSKAEEYLQNSLAITKEIGNRNGEATVYGNLGNVSLSLGKYAKAKNFFDKQLAISKETGRRKGEASSYGNIGNMFILIGDHVKAKGYLEKALVITQEIGHRNGEAAVYADLGNLFISLSEYIKAKDKLEKALAISQETGNVERQFITLCSLARLKFFQGEIREAFPYLLSSIQKCEEMRGFLGDDDQLKINFSHERVFPYWKLCTLLFVFRNLIEALCVSELGRARALADLMSAQYSVRKQQASVHPQSWADIERILKKESNCTCLYISYSFQKVMLWVLKESSAVHFREIEINDTFSRGLVRNLDDFLAENFRHLGNLRNGRLEDRSLNGTKAPSKLPQDEACAQAFPRIVEEEERNEKLKPSLCLCYKMIIAPVVALLEGPEILIVPDRSLYKVPFAALPDKSAKYLSETFRIRIVPSLTTLKLIQESPANYHSQTGALIVGDPDVGLVRYKAKKKNISRLPCAGKEAAMIGRLLGVHPLLGDQATKEAVLERINSVSLIHFAAHGDAERGEIALAPLRSINKIPVEEEYLLTMSDISRVQLRAKLVVLSCCHSGQGQIRVEGVVGIARAFLGSGARSVMVALWALEDSATEHLMKSFYEHLVLGKSASESLHEAMKWMRDNGFSDVNQWAPFTLIGDDVKFNFGK